MLKAIKICYNFGFTNNKIKDEAVIIINGWIQDKFPNILLSKSEKLYLLSNYYYLLCDIEDYENPIWSVLPKFASDLHTSNNASVLSNMNYVSWFVKLEKGYDLIAVHSDTPLAKFHQREQKKTRPIEPSYGTQLIAQELDIHGIKYQSTYFQINSETSNFV